MPMVGYDYIVESLCSSVSGFVNEIVHNPESEANALP